MADMFDREVVGANIERNENTGLSEDESFTPDRDQKRPFAFLGCALVEDESILNRSPAGVLLYKAMVSRL